MVLIRSSCGNVNSPVQINANECGGHAHTRQSYRPNLYYARDSARFKLRLCAVLPAHLCRGGHALCLYIAYVAQADPGGPLLKKVVIIHIVLTHQ